MTPEAEAAPSDEIPLGWALALYVLAVFLLLLVGVLLLPLGAASAEAVTPGALVLQGVLFLFAALLPAFALLRWVHGRPPAALGFPLHAGAFGETLRGFGLGVAVTLTSVLVMAAVGVVRWVADSGTVSQLLVEGGAALVFLALPAAAEEALFRGYPLQLLSRWWGPGWALLATSLGFSLLHAGNPGLTRVALLNLLAAGAFLGMVYLRTGSLWWATGAHLGWNWCLGFLVDLPVSGLELVDTPLWSGVASGPGWLSGGSFGPEGSVLTTVVVAAATFLLWRSRWLAPGSAVARSRPLAVLLAPGGPRSPEEGPAEVHEPPS